MSVASPRKPARSKSVLKTVRNLLASCAVLSMSMQPQVASQVASTLDMNVQLESAVQALHMNNNVNDNQIHSTGRIVNAGANYHANYLNANLNNADLNPGRKSNVNSNLQSKLSNVRSTGTGFQILSTAGSRNGTPGVEFRSGTPGGLGSDRNQTPLDQHTEARNRNTYNTDHGLYRGNNNLQLQGNNLQLQGQAQSQQRQSIFPRIPQYLQAQQNRGHITHFLQQSRGHSTPAQFLQQNTQGTFGSRQQSLCQQQNIRSQGTSGAGQQNLVQQNLIGQNLIGQNLVTRFMTQQNTQTFLQQTSKNAQTFLPHLNVLSQRNYRPQQKKKTSNTPHQTLIGHNSCEFPRFQGANWEYCITQTGSQVGIDNQVGSPFYFIQRTSLRKNGEKMAARVDTFPAQAIVRGENFAEIFFSKKSREIFLYRLSSTVIVLRSQ
jgi:hypothetical protein